MLEALLTRRIDRRSQVLVELQIKRHNLLFASKQELIHRDQRYLNYYTISIKK